MKKLFLTTAFMLIGAVVLKAQVKLTVEPFYIEPGETVQVNVYAEDESPTDLGGIMGSQYTAFQTIFKLPEGSGLTFEKTKAFLGKTYYCGPKDKTTGNEYHALEQRLASEQELRVVVYNADNFGLFPIKGEPYENIDYLFYVIVKADESCKPGIYSFDIVESKFAKSGKASDATAVDSYDPSDLSVKASIPANLDETVAYPYTEAFEKVDAKVNRTIKEGWNTVVYPFALTNDEVEAAFGEGTKVYNYTETTAGSVKFNSTTDGIAANVPVLVKATKAISAEEDLYFTDKAITSAEAGKVTGASYDFTGNYAGTIDIEAGNYLFSNGKLVKLTSGSTLKSYRAYLAANGASVKGLSIEIDDVPTGIELVNGEVETVGDIYTVGGQLVRRNSTVKGLPEGIYMINGNKVVVRK